MDPRPGEPDHGGRPSGDVWVPPEPADTVRPAWLPPGTPPGEPYGQPYGPYGGQPPPYGNPYGGPPPYGSGPAPGKPRMPPWAKVVLVVGIGFYLLSAVVGLLDLLLLER